MPRYRTEVAHGLGQAEALARLKALTEQAHTFSDLTGVWSENTFEFSLTAQGVGLTGTIYVEDDALRFEGRLPLIAMPFKGWIPRALRKSLVHPAALGNGAATPASPHTDSHDAAAATTDEESRQAPVVLFLHIPKAGGQTLGEYVYNQCRAEVVREDDVLNAGVAYLTYGFLKEPGLVVPDYVPTLLGRPELRAVIGHFWFGLHEHVARPSTYVTILRHPVDRVVSLYYYAKLHETLSLDEFVASPPFKEVDNDQTRRIAGVDPPLGECTEATLRAAQENLRRHFAVVGTTERFDEMLVLLKRKLGWDKEIISHPVNVNAARPKLASLPPETVAAIERRNQLDLGLWRYASQLMDEAIAAEGADFGRDLERYRELQRA